MHRLAQSALLLCVVPLLVLSAASPASAQGRLPHWSDTPVARLEALALLQTLNANLLSHDSATLTLDRWCDAHQMASPPHVVADRVLGIDKPPTAQQRQELEVSATEPVRYRRVRLRCGDHVLSLADNWYVPARLTPDMNHLLETSDVSFGRVVQPLHFWRRVLEATLLWSPLPPAWDHDKKSAALHWSPWPGVRGKVLRHRALLLLPDGHPISEVVETYTGEVLAFPEPRLKH